MSIAYFPKQIEAFKLLSRESPVKKLLYGGAAGGGKSFLIQDWQIQRRLYYAGTNGFIGRNDLGDLRRFTIMEVFDNLTKRGLVLNKHYRYDGRDMFIEFLGNKSRIYFIDMFNYPSDPKFKRFGSTAYLDGAIEEAAEVTEDAYNAIRSRIRKGLTDFCNVCGAKGLNTGEVTKAKASGKPIRWKCKKCGSDNGGLKAKILLSCNPDPGYLRRVFYEPWVAGTLPSDMAFLPSKAEDNPFNPEEYILDLNTQPEMERKRLRDGDWYYDTSNDTMFQYMDLIAAFSDVAGSGSFYITADIARLGKDRTVICVWHGLVLIEVVQLTKERTTVVSEKIRELMAKYSVLIRNVICDEDGIGGGVVDQLKCRGFLNGSPAKDPKKYANLKTQCFFHLADYIEKAKVTFRAGPKDTIIAELQAVRRKAPEGDTKLRINSKDEQKTFLTNNVSPDYADAIMMRMFFELNPNYGKYAFR